jgi:Malectin domain
VVRCTTVNITNVSSSTGPHDVYCSNHVFLTTVDVQPYQYQIPVPNTVSNSNYYAIRLHFAEIVRTLLLLLLTGIFLVPIDPLQLYLTRHISCWSFLTFKIQFYSTANARLMNISVEGIPVLKNLDILATVGKNAPYVYTVPQTFAVSDGGLTIALA